MGVAQPELSAGVLLYRDLLAAALGDDVVLIAPAREVEGPAPYAPDELFPEAWERREVSVDSEACLAAVRSIVAQRADAAFFFLLPWVTWRELPAAARAEIGRLDLHEAALIAAADVAAESSRLASLVPMATAVGERARVFRRAFFSAAAPELVITHDGLARGLGLHPQFRTVTMVCRCSAQQVPVRFFRVPRAAEHDGMRAEFRRLLGMGGGATANGYVLREALAPGSSLSHDLRAPDIRAGKADLEHLGRLRLLEEVGELFTGGVGQIAAPSGQTDLADSDYPLLIDGRCVAPAGIDVGAVRRRVDVEPERWLQPGDLLMRAIVDPTSERLVVAEVPPGFPPAAPSSSVLVLRFHAEVAEAQRKVIHAYLRSAFARRVVGALGGDGAHIRVSGLVRMLVPLADEDLQLALNDLESARTELQQWAEEADAAMGSLFERGTASQSRARLLLTGRHVRDRVRAASLVDDLGFRVRTMFPHPIAYRWRGLEAANPDREGYKLALETAENLVCYVAVMALTTARRLELPIPYVSDVVAPRLSGSGERGTTYGDWISIFLAVRDAGDFRQSLDRAPFPELFELWRDDSAKAAFDRLKQRRVEEAHGRGPEAHEVASAFGGATADIAVLLEGADFLADYPLRMIEATKWRELDGRLEYEFRDLRGDHPLVPQGIAIAGTPRLESQSLYFAARDGSLCRVTPFLIRAVCPNCGNPSTFCLDRYRAGDGVPVVRALEHRHTMERPDLLDEFRAAGLLT
jgi:hypothetical protein